MLLKKGSYSQSVRTEPTDAMTYLSETMSVASEEISTALNKTFAIINPPSFGQPGHEVHFTGEFPANNSMDDEVGHFTNSSSSSMLSHQSSIDRLAAIETATNFSDPKNVQLRTQSLKIVEIHGDSTPSMEEQAPTEVSAFQSEVTFDPDKYLMEAEAKQKARSDPPAELCQIDSLVEREGVEVEAAEVGMEGAVEQAAVDMFTTRINTINTLAGGRTPSPNETYISDASSDEEEGGEEVVAGAKAGENEKEVPSPLHSVTSSGSTTSSDWGKVSFGTREASLLDAVFDPEEDGEAGDDGTFDGTDCDGSTIDLDGSLNGDGTAEGPSSPHSHSSSIILEEYDEIDGLAAFAGIFVNLMSCNFTDLASNILIDDEDDYSVTEEEENQAEVDNSNSATNINTTLPNRKPVSEHVPTPSAPSMTASLWSFFGGSS